MIRVLGESLNLGSRHDDHGWPKQPPVLTAEQERAREAFVAAWHQQLPTRYRGIERFNHGSVSRLPVKNGSTTLEIGAGMGAHSKFEDLTRQQYYCLEYRRAFELRREFDVGARFFFPLRLPISALNLCVAFRLVPRPAAA